MRFLRFDSEAAARLAFAPWMVDLHGEIPTSIGAAAVDVVGVVMRPTGGTLQTEAGPVPELAPIPGWHVNLSDAVAELQQYEIDPPTSPDRVFAGAWPPSALQVPAKVARRQARQALLLAGLLDRVQPAIDAIEDLQQRQLAQIEWDDSQDFERHRPLLIQLGYALGLDDAGLDAIFIQAGGQ